MLRNRIVLLLTLSVIVAGCTLVAPRETPTSTPEPTLTPTSTYEPAVVISPGSGPPGTEVQVVAEDLPPETEVVVGIGPVASEYEVVERPTTDTEGALETTVTIPPEAQPGDRYVVAVDVPGPGVKGISNEFEVAAPATEPRVSISPQSGPPGSEIEVTASGFPPNQEVQVGAGREGTEFGVTRMVTTDAAGAVNTTITLPESAEPGDPWGVVVRVVEEGGARASSETFQIIGEAPEEASVSISPAQGPPGTRVAVSGSGFPSNAAVNIGVGAPASEYVIIDAAETDAEGGVQTTTTIPTEAEAGERLVVVVVTADNEVRGVSDPFDVTGGAVPSPTPREGTGGQFTRTNIFLIAVDDGGQSGKKIGCNDSVIPVEVEIEPTIAPLRASLEALLAIEEEYYGQSGLYNALYASDLEVGAIDIEQRQAFIQLSGTLSIGGVCDAPRVEAQLEETALQFSTVDRVSIFLNGDPLATYLSLQQ